MSFRRMRHIKAREFQGCDIAYDFSNPATLYDATSGGSLVAADGGIARANDVSGNTGHMLQTTSGYRPLRKVAALNGLDVARFDGTDDYLNAGDVGDIGTAPVEVFIVIKSRKVNSTANTGYFGKMLYGDGYGRWDLNTGAFPSIHDAFGNTRETFAYLEAATSASLDTQVLHGVLDRTSGPGKAHVRLRRNGTQVAISAAYTDSGASLTNAYPTLIAAYQNSSGSVPPAAGTYADADFGEAAKYSTLFNPAQRRRLELSRCRKWRIAS